MTTLEQHLARLQRKLAATPVEYRSEIELSIMKVKAVLAERAKRRVVPNK